MKPTKQKQKLKSTRWHRLDNTANIFPVVASRKKTNVFRVTAVLTEAIDPKALQQALEETLEHVPSFSVRLKSGLFWSYLESSNFIPKVEQETFVPCRFIDPALRKGLLFRMLYFENRIHLEIFHALTDGTGAMQFLKATCYKYLQIIHAQDFTQDQIETVYGLEGISNTQDGYMKNYQPAQSKTFKEGKAYTIKGEKLPADGVNIFHAIMSVQEIKQQCKKYNASITEYLAAQMAYGVYCECMGGLPAKKPVNIFVPVNLRKIFKTETSLNFFSNILVSLRFAQIGITFEDTIQMVKEQFAQRLNKQELQEKLAYTAGSQNNIAVRFMPLILKKLVLKIIYTTSVGSSTMPFSNLGLQQIEPEFCKYFEGFRFVLSTSKREPVTCTAIALDNELVFTISSSIENRMLPQKILHNIAESSVTVKLESNGGEI